KRTMLETKTSKAVPQRGRSSLWQTYSDNFGRSDWPKLTPSASQPVLNLLRNHPPLFGRSVTVECSCYQHEIAC
ncbi:MAG TPA: hypothetical protein VF088_09520, partial [Pyrinomonadaceae bacterium]